MLAVISIAVRFHQVNEPSFMVLTTLCRMAGDGGG
jgi:hypothetical protein